MPAIRRLSQGEAEVYRHIRLESLRESPEAFATTYDSALNRNEESWRAQANSGAQGDDRAIIIVLDDDRAIGLAALYRDTGDSTTGDLLQMWIAPSHRGGPTAAALLDHLFRWASERGFVSIRAEVTPGNLRALRFYEKHGFRPISSESSGTVLTKAVASPGSDNPLRGRD